MALGVSAAVVLVATSLLALHGHVPKFDASLTNSLVRDEGSGWFTFGDKVSLISSGPSVGLIALGFAAWVWWKFRDVALAAVVPLATGLGGISELAGKQIVGRLRPPSAVLIGEDGFGFPSGHTTGYTALAFSLVFVMIALRATPPRKAPAAAPHETAPHETAPHETAPHGAKPSPARGASQAARATLLALAFGTSIVVAISRVLVGAHRALDVIAGLALGIVSAAVATLIAQPGARRFVNRFIDPFTSSTLQSPSIQR